MNDKPMATPYPVLEDVVDFPQEKRANNGRRAADNYHGPIEQRSLLQRLDKIIDDLSTTTVHNTEMVMPLKLAGLLIGLASLVSFVIGVLV